MKSKTRMTVPPKIPKKIPKTPTPELTQLTNIENEYPPGVDECSTMSNNFAFSRDALGPGQSVQQDGEQRQRKSTEMKGTITTPADEDAKAGGLVPHPEGGGAEAAARTACVPGSEVGPKDRVKAGGLVPLPEGGGGGAAARAASLQDGGVDCLGTAVYEEQRRKRILPNWVKSVQIETKLEEKKKTKSISQNYHGKGKKLKQNLYLKV